MPESSISSSSMTSFEGEACSSTDSMDCSEVSVRTGYSLGLSYVVSSMGVGTEN